jgi:hypothetical protein
MVRRTLVLILTLLIPTGGYSRFVPTIALEKTMEPTYSEITSKILLDNGLVKTIRDAQKICKKPVYKKGRKITERVACNSWGKRKAAIIRWIQNSKLYPFRPLQRLALNSPNYHLVKVDPTLAANEDSSISRFEVFAAPETVNFIESLSTRAKAKLGVPLKITAITTGPDQDSDVHQTHLTGFAFDVRPLPGDAPTTWKNSNKTIYNRAMNKEFILHLAEEPSVKKIIFNDSVIIKDRKVQKALAERRAKGLDPLYIITDTEICIQKKWRNCSTRAHDNHLHIEIQMPKALETIAQELLEGSAGQKVTTSAVYKTPEKTKN